MRIITIRLVVEDVMNPSDQDAIEYVKEIINEAFGKEAMEEYPRAKLILMELRHRE